METKTAMEIDPSQTRCTQAYLVETIRSGQPRPYAASMYEYRLTITGKEVRVRKDNGADLPPLIVGKNLPIDAVKTIVQALCHPFYEKDAMPHPFAPELKTLEKVEDEPTHTTWHVLIRQEFCD